MRDSYSTAVDLVIGVQEHDVAATHAILGRLSHRDLMRVAVLLAASVDVEQPLAGHKDEPEPYRATVARIVRQVAAATNTGAAEIYSPSRKADTTEARHIACWVASAQGLKSTQIGRALHRDHSTILAGIDRVTRTPDLLAIARRIAANDDERKAA